VAVDRRSGEITELGMLGEYAYWFRRSHLNF
jgi:hypothetical protein